MAVERALRTWRRSREGLSLRSDFARALGISSTPRFAGVDLQAPDESTAWIVVDQISLGEYRHPGLTPADGWQIVDAGANIGVYSLWAARRGADVFAIEPDPKTFACLSTNTATTQRVRALNAAVVGEPRATIPLHRSDVRSTRHTVTNDGGSGNGCHDVVEVPAIALAEVLATPCDLLKLDCEGAEFEILMATSDDDLRRARRVILEFHRFAGDPAHIIDRFAVAGFNATFLAGSSPEDPVGMVGAMQ